MAKLIGIATHAESKGPITLHNKISVSLEKGLKEDYQGQKNPLTQVTLLSLRTWNKACEEVNAQLNWIERRANLLVDDMDFNADMVGQQIQVGSVLLEVTKETDPCARMDKLHPGLKQALTPDWSGGIRCKVLRAGTIELKDKVCLLKRV